MKGKLLLAVAAGAAGYVLGARAGREQYEQIRTQAKRIWQNPTVQEKTAQATETVKAKAPEAKEQVTEAARHAASKARTGNGRSDGATGASPKATRTEADTPRPAPGASS